MTVIKSLVIFIFLALMIISVSAFNNAGYIAVKIPRTFVNLKLKINPAGKSPVEIKRDAGNGLLDDAINAKAAIAPPSPEQAATEGSTVLPPSTPPRSLTKKKRQQKDLELIKSYFCPSNGKASNLICGDHIVSEFFKFIPREAEAEKIVNFMRVRQALRFSSLAPTDKSNNKLIAVPGSPGSGKSTFLKHFAVSQAFTKYIAESTKSDNLNPVIVASMTFNSGMDSKVDALGLRILYGALIANGYLKISEIAWGKFLEQFSSVSGWTAEEAVDFLLQIFGPDSRILLLVDELSKATNRLSIMQQLGAVLDEFGTCDVVVSSLSPQFVKSLLTKSNRQIEYVVLSSLLEARLGKEECLAWANTMIKNAGGADKVDPYMQALLRNIYMLYAGHPRALEILVTELRKIEDWRPFDSAIGDPNYSKPTLFFELLNTFPDYNFDFSEMSEKNLLKYVFSNPAIHTFDDTRFRDFVEVGKLLIYNVESKDRFETYVPSIALLTMLPRAFKNSKLLAVQKLSLDFRRCDKVEVLWERVVALNIITRSGTDITSTSLMNSLLGIRQIEGDFLSNWNIKVEKHSDYDPKSLHDCLVLPSEENHPGNEGSLHLFNKSPTIRFRFFLQMKISAPDKLMDVVASMICYNILEAMQDGTFEFANTHMILYIWNLSDANFELVDKGKDSLISNLTSILETVKEKAKKSKIEIPSGLEAIVESYIINYYDSNLHVLRSSVMREWLSPTLFPFPLFFTEIE